MLILARELLSHPHFIKSYSLGFLVVSALQKIAIISDHGRECIAEKTYGRFQALDVFCKHNQLVTVQHFTTNIQPGGICWASSSSAVLLRKLETALKDHQVEEAWVTFNDFKNLYGFPTDITVSKLLAELSYSSNPYWLQKACDLVFLTIKENSDLLQPEILSKLSVSLARAQKPVPVSMILRVMLERWNMVPVNVLPLVILHMVKSEIGTCLASNFLVQVCDYFLCLNANRGGHTKVIKPDTIIFNLVLYACVRFNSSLKGQQIVELMSRMGVIADAHSIIFIAQIHEMNGQRDEIKKFKDHIDQVSAPFLSHYKKFYDILLNLHFQFDDIDAASKLVLDMNRSRTSIPKQKLGKDIEKPFLVPIGSCNLKSGLKIQIMPELLQKDSIFKVEHKQELVTFRGGKLLLSNRGLAKLILGYKRHARISELSEVLLNIQEDFHTLGVSSLCSDVIDACICLGWLETAHDILDDMEKAAVLMGSTIYMALLTAYYNGEMFKEAKALLGQMKKIGLVINLSDEMVASTSLSEAADDASSSITKSDMASFLVREIRKEEQCIPPIVHELNSSIYYFCKAKMIEDALKTYRRMQDMKIQPTVQTFAYLVSGYSSLEMYRDITILWGDIKRNKVSRDLYELLLLNFLHGGYFERAMEVIDYMKECNMYIDKWMYKSEFLKLHKNLYKSLKASEAKMEAQSKRLEHVRTFKKFVGID